MHSQIWPPACVFPKLQQLPMFLLTAGITESIAYLIYHFLVLVQLFWPFAMGNTVLDLRDVTNRKMLLTMSGLFQTFKIPKQKISNMVYSKDPFLKLSLLVSYEKPPYIFAKKKGTSDLHIKNIEHTLQIPKTSFHNSILYPCYAPFLYLKLLWV